RIMPHIIQLSTGAIQENCYLIYNDQHLLIVDPGAEADKIITQMQQLAKQGAAILLPHTHYDHIGAVETLRHHHQIPVYARPLAPEWRGYPILILSGLARHDDMENIIVQPAEYEFEMKAYELGGMTFKVVPTPGHSIGSVSLIFDDFVVCGDALFKGSI